MKGFGKFEYLNVLEENLCLVEKQNQSKNFFQGVLKKELSISEIKLEKKTDKSKENEIPQEEKSIVQEEQIPVQKINEEELQKQVISSVPANLPTAVVQSNNLAENYNTTYKSVKIKNETKFNLTEEILTPNIEFTDKKNILIFHTHTCESYTPTPENTYVQSGNYRTTDLNYSVVRVGTVLQESLTQKGFSVVHSTEYHDYPAYNGSYNRSFSTVQNLLSQNPTTQLVIDLHRDAIGSMSNYAPSVQIGDETVSQLMFVIGTNGGGLDHPNWQTNLKFAIKIQEKANEMYPRTF